MSDETRKVLQFFTHKDMTLVLCSDGTIWDFKVNFVKGNETVVWRHRPEFENPQ